MTDNQIKRLEEKHRAAIVATHDFDLFAHDIGLDDLPTGSCGDASYLLAEYLRRNGIETIETIWVSNIRGMDSRAWLFVKDKRVKNPPPRTFSCLEELRSVVAKYGVENPDDEIDVTGYTFEDFQDRLLVDITALWSVERW